MTIGIGGPLLSVREVLNPECLFVSQVQALRHSFNAFILLPAFFLLFQIKHLGDCPLLVSHAQILQVLIFPLPEKLQVLLMLLVLYEGVDLVDLSDAVIDHAKLPKVLIMLDLLLHTHPSIHRERPFLL
mmetsp:Transcript_459/g.521  ORF Transcript_459/g.521 Transcript_459/m.521 type:complete len:129 (-) Transcript_459:237-623(-)